MISSALAFSAVFICGTIFYLFRHRRYFYLMMQLPGPTRFPTVGDIWLMCHSHDAILRILGATKVLPHPVFRIWGFPSLVITSRQEDLKIIFSDSTLMDRGAVGESLIPLLGPKSILTVPWPGSQDLKKTLIRAFPQADRERAFNSSRKAFPTLKVALDSNMYFSSMDHFQTYTLTSLLETCLPINNEELEEMAKILQPIFPFLPTAILNVVSPLHRNKFIFDYFLGGNRLNATLRRYYSHFGKIIEKNKAELSEFEKRGVKVPNIYIYKLLKEMPHWSNQEILRDLLSVIIAGLETSAGTAAFVAVVLGILPDIQQKVYEEGCKVREETKMDELTTESLANCLYLGRVVKEAQRMYPVVSVIPRTNAKEIKFGNYSIPRGSMMLGSALTLHRDPNIYDDPLTFNPDRFLPENLAKIPKHAYLPFGHGPRSCPGYLYGTTSVMYLVSNIVYQYKVYTSYHSTEELDKNLMILTNLADKRGFPIRTEKR